MNKKCKSLLLLTGILSFTGCKATINESRTIILEIDSDVIPEFTTNYGSGKYDLSDNTYTLEIPTIKDVYITLSHENMQPVTVHIPTSEMEEKTITKEVEFGQELNATVNVTVNGLTNLNDIQFNNRDILKNLTKGTKNTFSFTLPSRKKDYQFSFSLPGYQDTKINISKEQIISGYANITVTPITTEQVYIAFEGFNYHYKIYSMSTNTLVESGYKSSYNDQYTKYIILSNDDAYYVELDNKLIKINQGENATLFSDNKLYSHHGSLVVSSTNAQIGKYYIYYKNFNILSRNKWNLYDSSSAIGILFYDNALENWYYTDKMTFTYDSDYEQYEADIDLSNCSKVDLKITNINSMTNKLISSSVEKNWEFPYNYPLSTLNGKFETNIFEITIYQNEEETIQIPLYDKNNNLITSIDYTLSSLFEGKIVSGVIKYNQKSIGYKFPLFKDELTYKNGKLTYEGKKYIDLDNKVIKLAVETKYGEQTVPSSSFVTDEQNNTIFGMELDYSSYFALKTNTRYTLYYDKETYDFIISEQDMINGYVILSKN